jgi:YggT family protein
MDLIASAIHYIIRVAQILIFARVLISWVPGLRYKPIGVWLVKTVDPFLRPLQRLLPPWKTGGIDISPMLAFMILYVIERVLGSIFQTS